MEVSEAIPPLHLLDLELDLAVGLVIVVVEVRKIALQDTALQPVRRELETLRLRHERLTGAAHGKLRRRLHVVPLLLREGVDGLLLSAFLAFGQALVPPNSHSATRVL